MASTDLYALLKVDKDVQPPQLKKAYYALARKVHPDKRPGDAQAKADFLALKKAYDILSDPVRRRRYDRTGSVEDDADFAAAYEHYRGIPVSEEDIRATEAEYRHSDEERTDVVEYARKHSGDVARILESIIGSTDDDAERYRAAHLKRNGPNQKQFIVGDNIAIITVLVDLAKICNQADQVHVWTSQKSM